MADLLGVDRALESVLTSINSLGTETIPISESLNRITAVAITSEVNLPPFPNSSMDGFAVQSKDTDKATGLNPIELKLIADIPAGSTIKHTIMQGQAARIMTGAPLPDGADAVIPVEDTDAKWIPGNTDALPPTVTIYRSVKSRDYVRLAGEDVQIGQTLIPRHTVLRPVEIGLLASTGHATIDVVRKPRVAIISTGDELVEVDSELPHGKIRDSNSYTLAALVSMHSGIPIKIPTARDTLDDVRRCFTYALEQHPDLIISSAGVSVGAFDVVRTIIDELGHVDFWKINLRPGKPLAFGQVGGIPYFGLPGNPVSAMVTFDVFVRPALLQMAHRKDDAMYIEARIAEELHSDGRRSYLRVKLIQDNSGWIAKTTGTQSSGALSSMMLADGLLIVPEDATALPAGTVLTVRMLRPLHEIS